MQKKHFYSWLVRPTNTTFGATNMGIWPWTIAEMTCDWLLLSSFYVYIYILYTYLKHERQLRSIWFIWMETCVNDQDQSNGVILGPQLSIADFRNLWGDGGLSHQILDDVIWLAVYLHLWKIWKSVGIILPNKWKNNPNVPNHQPVRWFI